MTDNSQLSEFERKQIVSALEHVLSTDKFLAAPQMSAFLRYVVEQSVLGNKSRIKAYTVAIDALGKPDTFDPQNDPVVRVLAGRLRSSLNGYYENHSNTNVVIQMKPGSYVPVFINQQKNGNANNLPSDSEHVSSTSDSPRPLEDTNSAPTRDTVAQANVSQTESGHHRDDSSGNKLPLAQERSNITNAIISENIQIDTSTQPGISMQLIARLRQTPNVAIAAGVLALMLFTSYLNRAVVDNEPNIMSATPLVSALDAQMPYRARPDHLSIFVSAIDEGNILENQLNSMMSGVFSESEHVKVYRILEPNSNNRFWPEDYTLSIEVLNLPTETRVGIQLMAAQTGRISHSDTLVLSATAMQALTHEELEQITDFSRGLVSEQGPLVTDFQKAQASASNSLEQ
jgi:hypothetical protein